LGSNSVALNNTGQVIAIQHYSPYGSGDYSWGTMPTTYNYAGERLDSQTGLLYDNFRYYDPVIGRFVRSDNVQDNSTGMDPYAYVGDNPETRNDPSGHCWPLCTALIGAAAGALIGGGISIWQQSSSGKPINWGKVAVNAAVGAVAGALVGTGVGATALGTAGVVSAGAAVGLSAGASTTIAGIGTAAAIGAATGAATSAIQSVASGQSLANAAQNIFEGASIGAIASAATAGVGSWANLGYKGGLAGSQLLGRMVGQGTIQAIGGGLANIGGQLWDNWRNGANQPIDWGSVGWSTGLSFGAGAIGQWVQDRTSWGKTGTVTKSMSRSARAIQRADNSAGQSNVGNLISGIIQGGIQWLRYQ
jgi:RHS repeat-associated protein